MTVSRRWVVNLLREIGHPEAADRAAPEGTAPGPRAYDAGTTMCLTSAM
jgi:hypothetical protein